MESTQVSVPKTTKFLIVQDVFKKREVEGLVNAPSGGTNFIFWYNTPESDKPDVWGLTIKQMVKSTTKKYSTTHVWKCTWYYDLEANLMKVAANSKSIAQDLDENNSAKLKEIFEQYLGDKKVR